MSWIMIGILLLQPTDGGIKTTPLVEQYLHSGQLAKGEQMLTVALAKEPGNDQLRFGLGVLQVFRGVERLGQALHEHGVKSEHTNVPFLRLPVPPNPNPTPISYAVCRRILDDFRRDLLAAEATFAAVTDDQVKLPLRLASVRLDLDGDGNATDRMADILRKLVRQEIPFLKANPEFLVCFDRGDVAWLRAYCHLLSAMIDFYLAFDTQASFDNHAHGVFANPKVRTGIEKPDILHGKISIPEPLRLHRFRTHLLQVCVLNRETWRFIRAERDDDHEWLPNPKQKGVLGLPVRDNMIDAWLGMIGELEAVLKGDKLLPLGGGDTHFNLKAWLDDPPSSFTIMELLSGGAGGKYLTKGEPMDIGALLAVGQVFGDSLSFAYAMWFN
jgi:hypothetical protein